MNAILRVLIFFKLIFKIKNWKKLIFFYFTFTVLVRQLISFSLDRPQKEGQLNVLLGVAQDKGQSARKQDCPS